MQPAAAAVMATAISAGAARMHAERRLTVALATYASPLDSEPPAAGPDLTLQLRAALARARAVFAPAIHGSPFPGRSSVQSVEKDERCNISVSDRRSADIVIGESAYRSGTDDFAYSGSSLALIGQ